MLGTNSSSSAFIDGIFRTDTSAGSSHRGGQTLASLEGSAAGFEAAKLATDSQNPVDIDPGNYEVVLGHEAVSTILVFLEVYGFNAKSKIDGMSPIIIGEHLVRKEASQIATLPPWLEIQIFYGLALTMELDKLIEEQKEKSQWVLSTYFTITL